MSISGISTNQNIGNWKPSPQTNNTDMKIQALERDLQKLNTEKQKAIQRKDQEQAKKIEKRIQEIEKQIRELQRKKEDNTESVSANEQSNEKEKIPSSDGIYIDELV